MFPASFYCGDRVNFTLTYPDYSPEVYGLSVYLRGPDSLDLEATASGSDFVVNITSAQTSALIHGQYYYQAVADDGDGDRVVVEAGSLKIFASLADTVEPYDGRSDLQKLFDEVTAAIQSLVQNNVKEYQIKERKFIKQDLPELIKWRDKLKMEVYREKNKTGFSGIQIGFR